MNNQITKGAMQKLSVLFVLVLLGFYGCDNPSEVQNSTLSVTFFSEGNLQKIENNILLLNSVKVLIRNLKIKTTRSNDSSDVNIGPFVINLNPDGNNTDVSVTNIPSGSYERVKFEVHKLEDSEVPPDPEFKDGASGSERYSVIIKGIFNGNQFTYKSRRSTYQEIQFPSAIRIDDNVNVNLTIKVNPYSWFFVDGDYLNPDDASNESKIEMSIEDSFKDAFRDNNIDGNPD